MDSARSTAVSLMNFARSYLETAQHVIRSMDKGDLRLAFDAPAFALLAHALELQLKSALIAMGMPPADAEGFKHDISRLYAACREHHDGPVSIAEIENNVRGRWKTHLRVARDSHHRRVSRWVGSECPDTLREFGVFDNDHIGRELPEVSPVIQWMSERHSAGGSRFRYPKSGLDWQTRVTAFGLNENVPMRTAEWACEEFDTALRHYFFPNEQKRPGHS